MYKNIKEYPCIRILKNIFVCKNIELKSWHIFKFVFWKHVIFENIIYENYVNVLINYSKIELSMS